MKIAFLANEYPPLPAGGIGTNLRNLARALVRDGHQVWVVGWGHDAVFDDQGVTVRFVGTTRVPKAGWWLNRRRAFRALARLVAEEGVEIVEAPDWCGPSAGLSLPWWAPGCPVVIRCHGSAVYFGDLLNEPVRRSVRLAERTALRGADAVGAVSRFAGERTRALFDLKAPVTVLPNGIDTDRFVAADPAEVDPGSVLYFGTLVRKKGVLDLPPMLDDLLRTHPQAHLRLLGRDGADAKTGAPSTWRLAQQASSEAARACTEYLGVAPYAEVEAHVRRAAVCVFPSYGEALPLAWLEALACAKPVVAYDIGWAREVITPGETGLLVDAGDTAGLARAIGSLLDEPTWAARMGQAGREDVCRRFSSEAAARASLDWFQQIVAEHQS